MDAGIAPPAVPSAARVRLVAPCSPFDPALLDQGRAALGELGWMVSASPSLEHADRYLAATDDERLHLLVEALAEPGADLVMAARGGFGLTRLLQGLDAVVPRLRDAGPRWFAGFSDLTALHAWLLVRLGWQSVHGPVCTSLVGEAASQRTRLRDAVSGVKLEPLTGTPLSGRGTAEGVLVGGNAAVLMALAGTPWWPVAPGTVVLLEDVDERPHRLDRMLTQLGHLTGGFSGIAGVALGHFTRCDDEQRGHLARDTLASFFRGTDVRAVWNLPVGHQAPNNALRHGSWVKLDVEAGTLA